MDGMLITPEILASIDDQIRRAEMLIEQQRLSIAEQQSSPGRLSETRSLERTVENLVQLRTYRHALRPKPVRFR
jgi:hypothetical protein